MNNYLFNDLKDWYGCHRIVSLVLGIIILVISLLLLSPGQPLVFYTFMGLKGMGISLYMAIISYKRGTAPAFLDRFCSLTASTDCLKVIQSRPLGVIDMVDVGVIYFVGGLFVLLTGLAGFHTYVDTTILFALSWLSVPYLVFSLYYQYAVVKKWCTLCLSVWCVMAGEVILSLYYVKMSDNWLSYWKNVLFVGAIFLFTATVWGIVSKQTQLNRG